MYQDVYVEKSIKRKAPGVTKIYNVILIAITALAAFNFVVVDYKAYGIPLIAMLIITYFVTQNTKIDYDYVYTNGSIQITRIKRRNKRQDLIDCEMKDVVVVAPSKTEPVQPYIGRNMTTYDCLSHEEGVPYYTMIVRDPGTGREIKVLFEPGMELLNAMHQISPDKVHI